MRKRTLVVALVVLAVPVLGWAFATLGNSDLGRTATAVRSDFRLTVEATGTLEAAVFYEIGPPSVNWRPPPSRRRRKSVTWRCDCASYAWIWCRPRPTSRR